MLVERIGYRPLRNAPRASAAITGLMIGIILETGNLAILGASRQKFPEIIETTTFQLGEVSLTNTKIFIVLISLADNARACTCSSQRTKWGMADARHGLRSPSGGAADGCVDQLHRSPNLRPGFSAGCRGGRTFYGMAYPVLDPYMGIEYGWKAFVAAILGGRGSVVGAAFAGFLMGFLDIFVATYFPSTMRNLISFSIILMILSFRPHGFFGRPYSAQLRL
jgi:branched-chain amino acid transport system permease protein